MEKPDYEKMTSIVEVETEIQKYKETIVRKVKVRGQTKENRKEAMKGYNDALKELEEELDFSTVVIDELERHKRLLQAAQQHPGVAKHLASV